MAVVVTGAAPHVRRELLLHGVRPPVAAYAATVDEAVAALRQGIAGTESGGAA